MPQGLVGLERGYHCFNNPVFPDDDGLALLPYDGCLTYEGELNKMAGNIALGRYTLTCGRLRVRGTTMSLRSITTNEQRQHQQ